MNDYELAYKKEALFGKRAKINGNKGYHRLSGIVGTIEKVHEWLFLKFDTPHDGRPEEIHLTNGVYLTKGCYEVLE